MTSETRYIYADQPTSNFTLVLPRVNVSYSTPLACGPLRVTLGPLLYLTVPVVLVLVGSNIGSNITSSFVVLVLLARRRKPVINHDSQVASVPLRCLYRTCSTTCTTTARTCC